MRKILTVLMFVVGFVLGPVVGLLGYMNFVGWKEERSSRPESPFAVQMRHNLAFGLMADMAHTAQDKAFLEKLKAAATKGSDAMEKLVLPLTVLKEGTKGAMPVDAPAVDVEKSFLSTLVRLCAKSDDWAFIETIGAQKGKVDMTKSLGFQQLNKALEKHGRYYD